VRLVEEARTLPMSASAVVHRGEVLALLERVRRGVREALQESRSLLGDREAVLAEGRAEVERLREEALAERARLVEATSVHREACAQAERLLATARAQAEAMRSEVEDYVDGKLANFEVVLSKTLAAVQKGRARLMGQTEHDELR
jgi:F0F1-type ATP synthase membrane subunit b/b'